jgi:hypothetical protein
VVLHDIIERIYFYLINFSQKEMGSEKHTADMVLHDMIEQIYFTQSYSHKMKWEARNTRQTWFFLMEHPSPIFVLWA